MNKVTLPDGRVVSRQRAWQIRHPDKQAVFKKKYDQTEKGKITRAKATKKWYDNFEKRMGMSYGKWYYEAVVKTNNLKEKRGEDGLKNQEPNISQPSD